MKKKIKAIVLVYACEKHAHELHLFGEDLVTPQEFRLNSPKECCIREDDAIGQCKEPVKEVFVIMLPGEYETERTMPEIKLIREHLNQGIYNYEDTNWLLTALETLLQEKKVQQLFKTLNNRPGSCFHCGRPITGPLYEGPAMELGQDEVSTVKGYFCSKGCRSARAPKRIE